MRLLNSFSWVPGFLIKLFNLAGDEFFQLHHVGGELANPLAGFFIRHCVIVEQPAELLLV